MQLSQIGNKFKKRNFPQLIWLWLFLWNIFSKTTDVVAFQRTDAWFIGGTIQFREKGGKKRADSGKLAYVCLCIFFGGRGDVCTQASGKLNV